MPEIDMSIIWLVLIIIGVVTEIASLGLTSIWFAVAALISFILAKLGVSVIVQVIVFIVATALMLFYTKPIAKKYLKIGQHKTNAEALIGQTAKVTEQIDNINGTGKVFINGMFWTARTPNEEIIDETEIVKIIKIEGVKLIVTRES